MVERLATEVVELKTVVSSILSRLDNVMEGAKLRQTGDGANRLGVIQVHDHTGTGEGGTVGGGAAQTPWVSNIDAATFDLTDVGELYVGINSTLVVGDTVKETANNTTPNIQVLDTTTQASVFIAAYSVTDTVTGSLVFGKSSSGTLSTDGLVADNEAIGKVIWVPNDGSNFHTQAAEFGAEVDDVSPGSNDIGMAFVWSQMAAGVALRETMRLSADGRLLVPTGLVTIGNAGFNQGILSLHGQPTGSSEGGELQLFLADDDDGTFAAWILDVFQDDFRILRSDGASTLFYTAAGRID